MMVLGKLKEKSMKYETIAFIIAMMLGFISVVLSVTYYHIKKDEAIKSSVESAIVKGIDPMSVRCAYGSTDSVCLVYAANLGKK